MDFRGTVVRYSSGGGGRTDTDGQGDAPPLGVSHLEQGQVECRGHSDAITVWPLSSVVKWICFGHKWVWRTARRGQATPLSTGPPFPAEVRSKQQDPSPEPVTKYKQQHAQIA